MTGSTARDGVTGAGLRVSDAERDAVTEELAQHLQDGRLDATEFDERVSQAMTARTRGDLDRLLADLPRQVPEQPSPARRRPGWPFPLVPIALVVLFVAVAGAVGRTGGHGHPVWALVGLWWLIPVAIFAARGRLRRYRPHADR